MIYLQMNQLQETRTVISILIIVHLVTDFFTLFFEIVLFVYHLSEKIQQLFLAIDFLSRHVIQRIRYYEAPVSLIGFQVLEHKPYRTV